jgi:hypothetical protein
VPYHKDVQLQGFSTCDALWDYELVGAGMVEKGEVTDWESIGFEIVTPDELKPAVLMALQQKFVSEPK